jgi:hypothetical protein
VFIDLHLSLKPIAIGLYNRFVKGFKLLRIPVCGDNQIFTVGARAIKPSPYSG